MSIRLAYIIQDYGLISETFIKDLINKLSMTDLDLHLIYQTAHEDLPQNINAYQCHFGILTTVLDKVKFRMDKNIDKQYSLQQINAQRALAPLLEEIQPDIIYVDYGFTITLFYELLIKKEIPYIVHLHGADITARLNDIHYRERLNYALTGAKHIIVASNHIRRLVELETSESNKVKVIRYGLKNLGIDPIPYNERTPYPSLVFLGRLTPKKHPVALIEMMRILLSKLPEIKLTIIGDGEELCKVKQRVKKHGLEENVELVGAKTREEALPIVARHWVYVQHSVTSSKGDQEGFGISLAEAALLELPVVSTLHNGIPEQVIDKITGYLVPEFDFEMMAKKVLELVNNSVKMEEMGKAGKKNIEALCSWEKRLSQVNKLINQTRNL